MRKENSVKVVKVTSQSLSSIRFSHRSQKTCGSTMISNVYKSGGLDEKNGETGHPWASATSLELTLQRSCSLSYLHLGPSLQVLPHIDQLGLGQLGMRPRGVEATSSLTVVNTCSSCRQGPGASQHGRS